MGDYWRPIFWKALRETRSAMGADTATLVNLLVPALIVFLIRWAIYDWATVTDGLWPNVGYSVLGAVVWGALVVGYKMLRIAAEQDRALRDQLSPLGYDHRLTTEMRDAIKRGQALYIRAHKGEGSETLAEDFAQWNGDVAEMLMGRVDADEWFGLETVHENLELGPSVIMAKTEKLRRILMRYAKKAPASQLASAAISSSDQI
jgi:hypothetical protein